MNGRDQSPVPEPGRRLLWAGGEEGLDLAVIPIGDHYTMGPREAAVALELLGTKRCVPCHWGTFPVLTGTPQELKELAPAGVQIEMIEPGDSVTM